MRLVLAFAALILLAVPASGFDSGDIHPGASWAHTFHDEKPDGHHYHCHPHPWMKGMVHVVADTDGAVRTHHVDIVEGDASDDWGYAVPHLYIEAADTVVWTNTGRAVHTVSLETGDHAHHDGGGAGDANADHDGDPHDHGQEAPAPVFLAVLAVLILAAALRRRP